MTAFSLRRRRQLSFGALSSAGLAAVTALASAARAQAVGAAPRVVCVGGALTEIVYRLGAGSLLVGTDTTSLYPEAAQATPKVGYARALSAEGVLSLRPTVLIAGAEAGPPAAVEQLRSAGVRLVRADPSHSFDALLRNVRLVAEAIGQPAVGEALVAEITAQWRATVARIAPPPNRPRVLFVLSHVANNVQVSGAETAAHAVIEMAGAQNALHGFKGYRPLTAEAVIGAAPQVILTTAQGAQALGGAERLLAQPGLALTPAGKAGRVLALDALYLLGGGPRLPQAVAEVARFVGTLT
jgi:iron complex transport system substrate-binding protein